jgi:hypothetical protein
MQAVMGLVPAGRVFFVGRGRFRDIPDVSDGGAGETCGRTAFLAGASG